MCGIAGWIGPSLDIAAARVMSTRLAHRGPDDAGEWQEGSVWLAQRRLSIVDLSPTGHQPMPSASGRYVLTYNGEVYNAPELSFELARLGHTFCGHSDTEVMLAAFEQWGVERALARFNGMFAFAVWDRRTQSLLLARDRMGEKPLYYAERDGNLAFASELGSLWQLPWLDKRIDRNALAAYFRYLCVPAPAAIIQGARKLAPGTLYRWTQGRGELHAYWTVANAVTAGAQARIGGDIRAAADELDALLRDAIRLRLRSDVPFGAFLSGGLDSSLVVALMQQEANRPVSTFTIGFAEKSHDESGYARAVAAHIGTRHSERILSAHDVIDLVPAITRIHDEPFADSSSIPTALLARFARTQVTVALSGDGGDELFGGYPRYFWAGRIQRLRRRLTPFGAAAFSALLDFVPAGFWNQTDQRLCRSRLGGANGLAERVRRFSAYLRCPPEQVYHSIVSAWKNPAALVCGSFDDNLNPDVSGYADLSWAESMMAVDQEHYLPDDILTKMDRATMAVALEGRAPLLDHRLVEWAWRVRPQHKLSEHGDRGKLLMRELLYRYVPKEMIERPKMGFGMPIGHWLRQDLREWAEAMLEPGRLASVGLDARPVRVAWREHLVGKNRLPEIWTVLMWVQWQENWKASL